MRWEMMQRSPLLPHEEDANFFGAVRVFADDTRSQRGGRRRRQIERATSTTGEINIFLYISSFLMNLIFWITSFSERSLLPSRCMQPGILLIKEIIGFSSRIQDRKRVV